MSSATVFVDSGAWFATIDTTDEHYGKASSHLRLLIDHKARLATSNFVVNETAMLLARKVSKERAIAFVAATCNDPSVQVLPVDWGTQQQAYRLFEKYAGQDFSITDCTTFVLMKAYKIKRAFAFDRHFDILSISREPHDTRIR
jgi:uncharacterized protein